jgi:hypothetical protein
LFGLTDRDPLIDGADPNRDGYDLKTQQLKNMNLLHHAMTILKWRTIITEEIPTILTHDDNELVDQILDPAPL